MARSVETVAVICTVSRTVPRTSEALDPRRSWAGSLALREVVASY